jgi:hypothetical protein
VPEPPPRHAEPTSPANPPARYDRAERPPRERWERTGNGFHRDHGDEPDN